MADPESTYCENLKAARDKACGISSQVAGNPGPLTSQADIDYVTAAADDGTTACEALLNDSSSPIYTPQSTSQNWTPIDDSNRNLTQVASDNCAELTALYEAQCGSTEDDYDGVALKVWQAMQRFDVILVKAGINEG